jgi:hypothetical protein
MDTPGIWHTPTLTTLSAIFDTAFEGGSNSDLDSQDPGQYI